MLQFNHPLRLWARLPNFGGWVVVSRIVSFVFSTTELGVLFRCIPLAGSNEMQDHLMRCRMSDLADDSMVASDRWRVSDTLTCITAKLANLSELLELHNF